MIDACFEMSDSVEVVDWKVAEGLRSWISGADEDSFMFGGLDQQSLSVLGRLPNGLQTMRV